MRSNRDDDSESRVGEAGPTDPHFEGARRHIRKPGAPDDLGRLGSISHRADFDVALDVGKTHDHSRCHGREDQISHSGGKSHV